MKQPLFDMNQPDEKFLVLVCLGVSASIEQAATAAHIRLTTRLTPASQQTEPALMELSFKLAMSNKTERKGPLEKPVCACCAS